MKSIKQGYLNSASTWDGKRVPRESDNLIIEHIVTVERDVKISGITVNPTGELKLAPNRNIKLRSSRNIIVAGKLTARPVSTSYTHHIEFTDIDETKFVGGGMDILDTDIGLWVIDNGILDIVGDPKSHMVYANNVKRGDTIIKLVSTPNRWRVGDEISIAPMESATVREHYKHFDRVIIKSITANNITIDRPLQYDHDVVNGHYPEVMNLSRNVKISGTMNGYSHVMFLMTKKKQIVQNVESFFLGVNSGRYGWHFHHCKDGSIDSNVINCVVKDCNNHAFVAHASNKVEFYNCISYNTINCAYWWDSPPNNSLSTINNSDNILYFKCIAALTNYTRPYSLASFKLSGGMRNKMIGCIAMGNYGSKGSAGVVWGEDFNYVPNEWEVLDIVVHNNRENGTFNWQNDSRIHDRIRNITCFNCNVGVMDGAYHNAYRYDGLKLFNNTLASLVVHAMPIPTAIPRNDGYKKVYENLECDGDILILKHTIPNAAKDRLLFKNLTFRNLIIRHTNGVVPGYYDFVNATYLKLNIESITRNTNMRIQNIDKTIEINDKGESKDITPFYQNL